MKTLFATLTVLAALVAMTSADEPATADTAAGPAAEPAADTAAEPAAAPAPAAPAEPASPLTEAQRSALSRELWDLQSEIIAARQKAGESADIQVLRKKIEDLSSEEKPDVEQIRKLNAEVRTLAERHLAEMPGMVAKLARLKEVGELLRRDLPAEQRRKGPRLPPKAEPPAQPE